MRKRKLSAVVALVLALTMSFSSIAAEITGDTESAASAKTVEEAAAEVSSAAESSASTEGSSSTENSSSTEVSTSSESSSTTESSTSTESSSSTNGTTSEGSTTDGTATNGTTADGTSADGTVTDGTTTDGTSVNGTTGDGSTTDGTATGTTSDGSAANGTTGDGSTSDGTSTNGTVTDGTTSDGTTADGTAASGEGGGHVHTYEDVWDWDLESDPVTAVVTLTCAEEDCTEDTDGHTVTLGEDEGVEITSETTEAVVDEYGEVTEEGSITYTASVEYEDIVYTDEQSVTLPDEEEEDVTEGEGDHVHTYEDVWDWDLESDPVSAVVTLTCAEEDCTEDTDGHTVTLGADEGVEITSETTEVVVDENGEVTEAGSITYTASVEYKNVVYTDEQSVILPYEEEGETGCEAGSYEETTAGGIRVTLEWEEGAFAEDPEVVIEDLDEETAFAYVEEALEGENVTISAAYGVDITFYVDGEEAEPASAVRVGMELPVEAVSETDNVYVVHKHDDEDAVVLKESAGNVESLNVDIEEESETITVDLLLEEFSPVVVTLGEEDEIATVTEYNGYTWSGGTNDLSASTDSSGFTTITITGSGTLTLTSSISARVIVGALNSTTYQNSEISVTIDLAGHTMTGDQANSVILVGDYTSVTLMDSSKTDDSEGTGKITAGGGTKGSTFADGLDFSKTNYQWGGNVAVGTGGTFTLKSGTITAASYKYGNIANGGGVYVYDGTFIMNGGTISNNSVSNAGGGIFIRSGYFYMDGGTVTNNAAIDGGSGAGIQIGKYDGYLNADGTVNTDTVSTGTVTAVISGGTISNNTSTYHAGGIYVMIGTLTMTGGTISGNTCGTGWNDAGFTYAAVGGYGGGVAVNYDATFNMTGGTIENNTANASQYLVGKYGSLLYNYGGYGGGVCVADNTYNSTGNTFNFSGGIIRNNTTGTCGANVAAIASNNTVKMTGGTITGGSFTNTSSTCGTGVYLASATMTMSGGTIDRCTGSTYGGGVYMSGATLTMSGGTIESCSADTGGGIYSTGKSTISLNDNANIKSCSAISGNGGGIDMVTSSTSSTAYSASITMSGGSIESCTASGNGGGIYSSNTGRNYTTTITLSGGNITNCSAVDGGGIYAAAGSSTNKYNPTTTINVGGGSITGCTASESGGGIYVVGGGNTTYTSEPAITLTNGSITGNAAGSSTDSEDANSGEDEADNESGTSTGIGGGVYVDAYGSLTATGGVLANNTATASAADVYCSASGSVELDGVSAVNTDTEYQETGFYIDGWYEDTANSRYSWSDNVTTELTSTVASETSGTEYFIIAALSGYHVYYEKNAEDATGSTTDSNLYAAGETVAVKDNGFTRDGYIFVGWSTASGASEETTVSSASGLLETLLGSFTITAMAAETSVTAQYITNTDKSTAESAGVTFSGTNDNKFTMPSSDVTLYAQWVKGYTLTYNGNAQDGGEVSGVPEDKGLYASGKTVSLSGDVPTHTDVEKDEETVKVVFVGWSTTQTDEIYSAGEESELPDLVTSVTFNSSDITVYAVWSYDLNENGTPDVLEDTYTVTYTDGVNDEEVFEDQAYSGLLSGLSLPSYADEDGEAATPTREGYTFLGWSTDGETVLDLTDAVVTGDVTYIAVWERITYTVTYTDGVDDEEVFADESTTVGSGDAVPDYSGGTPTREGYTFLGWSTDGSTVLDLTDVVVTGDIIYIAVWETTTTTTTTTSTATGALGIIKVDAATGARLAGATFALYNDTTGTLLGYYTTDSNGCLQTSQLTLNYTYSFVEVTAPEGYVLDSTAHSVTLTSDLSSSSSSPYVLTISNTAESSVLTEERDIETGTEGTEAEEPGVVLDADRSAGTGDESNLLLWLVLLCIAGATLGGAVYYTARRRRSRHS